MTGSWEDVNARAHGLATHLLRRATLDSLARSPDLAALAGALSRLGYVGAEEAAAGPAELELAVRRRAAREFRTLGRWCARRPELVTVLFEDEDRRSLRALFRGAVHGAPADARLAGLIPTPALPERALEELARQPSASRTAALLVAWGNPYGRALLAEAEPVRPDLLRLESRVNETFARRALAAGRKGGARLLRYVSDVIDVENARAALVLAEQPEDMTPKDAFLAGGRRFPIAAFEQAIVPGRASETGRRLAQAFAGTRVARAFASHAHDAGRLERETLRALIAELAAEARLDPLTPAPVLEYALRLRAQALDLRRIIWGVALGAPPGILAPAATG